ncbi:MAG TPA: metallophosphoesterase family protein [Vicinamibacteria bacterium]|nr:metallophosphoesterase family protein [Vicinamibacteria bacterium]
MRLGLVADLHGRFDPLLPKVLAGVARILVAGDLVDEGLLGRLAALAPIEAVRGNNDTSPGFLRLPEFLLVEEPPLRLLIAHDRRDRRLAREISRHQPDVLVVGHSHKPLVDRDGSLLVVNPGSCGPKRFSLPRTAGTLTLASGRPPKVELWDLESDRPYRPSR